VLAFFDDHLRLVASAHAHHNLSDVLAALHQPVSRRRFSKWERLKDRRGALAD